MKETKPESKLQIIKDFEACPDFSEKSIFYKKHATDNGENEWEKFKNTDAHLVSQAMGDYFYESTNRAATLTSMCYKLKLPSKFCAKIARKELSQDPRTWVELVAQAIPTIIAFAYSLIALLLILASPIVGAVSVSAFSHSYLLQVGNVTNADVVYKAVAPVMFISAFIALIAIIVDILLVKGLIRIWRWYNNCCYGWQVIKQREYILDAYAYYYLPNYNSAYTKGKKSKKVKKSKS